MSGLPVLGADPLFSGGIDTTVVLIVIVVAVVLTRTAVERGRARRQART